MRTAIDTNVLAALWNEDDALNRLARSSLDEALSRGGLVISAPVFAELLAAPGRDERFLDSFCEDTGIAVDWEIGEKVWRAAGRAFQTYAGRQKNRRSQGPRRILAGFLIGAHAMQKNCRLLTLDERLYRTAFPRLSVIPV